MKTNRKTGTAILHDGSAWTILGYDKKSDLYLVSSLDGSRELYLAEDQMTTAP